MTLSHQTNDTGESEWIHFTGRGYLLRTDVLSYRLKRLPVKNLPPVWLSSHPALWRSYSSGMSVGVCRIYPISTGNQKQHEIINHGNSAGYSDCVAAGQYRLNPGIIFDNDEDKRIRQPCCPCIEQAGGYPYPLRQLQLQPRTGEFHSSSHSPDFIPLTPA